MTVDITFTCDYCGKDISVSHLEEEWRLTLVAERLPSIAGPDGLSMEKIGPAIETNKHFCNKEHLRNWALLEDRVGTAYS